MTVFVTIMIVLFLVLIGWTWSSLGNIETKTKIICMVCGIIATYIITFIIYNISKIGITYENQEAMKTIRTVFVILFTIYEILSLMFLFIINNSIYQLKEMNDYTEGSFEITNNIYINIGLCQLMALTNQTDLMLAEYFGTNVTSTDERDGFIRKNIERTAQSIFRISNFNVPC